MELSNAFFGHRAGCLGYHVDSPDGDNQLEEETEESTPLYGDSVKSNIAVSNEATGSCFVHLLKNLLWWILGMPLWCKMASRGKRCLTSHITEMALQTPHPIRIGNVRFARAKISSGDTHVVMLKNNQTSSNEDRARKNLGVNTRLLRADSLPRNHDSHRMADGAIVALPTLSLRQKTLDDPEKGDYQSINQQIGALARRQLEEEKLALEDDPQGEPPSRIDFFIAVFYVIFGVIAMAAGLLSIFV